MYTTNKTNKAVRLALAFGAASAMAFTGMAQAETDNNEEEVDQVRPERIQVIGSRIRTDGIDSATPIEIISSEIVSSQGLSTVGELLRTATVASGSNQLISAMSVGNVTEGGAGNESISMRGLGSNRTLVLLNGRRAGPAGTRGQVSAFDMNSLPVSAVERVEILKDGASSLYGSDAVAGVINIITKRGDDSSINASLSQPLESGGERFRINGTLGRTFDRGSFRVVGDYRHDKELARGDRKHFDCSERYIFAADSNERLDPIDPRTGEFHCADLPYGMWLWNAGASNYTATINSFDYDGFHAGANRTPYTAVNPGDISTPNGWYPVGYDAESDGWLDTNHPFLRLATMNPEEKVSSVYTQFDYDLTDTISFYSELMHSRRQTTINGYRQFWEPFIPAWIGLVDGWDGDVFLDPTTVTDHSGSVTTVDYTRGVIGFEGSIGLWSWDASLQRSLNRGQYDTKIILEDALVMASDAIWGDPCEGEFSPISNRPCYAVPFFDPEYIRGNHNQQTKDFLYGMDHGYTIYKQDTFDAYITGDLFELPAGDIGTAIGMSYQTDEIKDTPGENTLAGNSWGMTSAGVTAGRSNTRAVYGEVKVPLLRDLPMVEYLELTASARWTDVSTYGSGTTYKLGAVWDLGHGFRVRGARGTSFRAPALFELFLDNQTSFFDQRNDPCWNWGPRDDDGSIDPNVAANCAADGVPRDYAQDFGSGTQITGGGAGVLEAETSVSKGIGLVYTSDNNVFAASMDYYDIVIDDQVSNVGGVNVLNLCYASENFANEPFCDQVTRRSGAGGDWGIDTVRGGYVNVAQQKVRGVDFMVSYNDDTPFGHLRMTLSHSMQIERSFKQFPDSDRIQYIGRLGNPRNSGTLYNTLRRDDWIFNWNVTYFSKVNDYDRFADGPFFNYRGTPARRVFEAPTTIYHTFSTNRTFDNGFDVTLGVANAFDKKPPITSTSSSIANVGNALLYSQYDQFGRRIFLNVAYEF
jgi:iron complex outermembrane receptor protein